MNQDSWQWPAWPANWQQFALWVIGWAVVLGIAFIMLGGAELAGLGSGTSCSEAVTGPDTC